MPPRHKGLIYIFRIKYNAVTDVLIKFNVQKFVKKLLSTFKLKNNLFYFFVFSWNNVRGKKPQPHNGRFSFTVFIHLAFHHRTSVKRSSQINSGIFLHFIQKRNRESEREGERERKWKSERERSGTRGTL